MIRLGKPGRSTRRRFVAGLCVIAPLAFMGARGLFTFGDGDHGRDKHLGRVSVTDNAASERRGNEATNATRPPLAPSLAAGVTAIVPAPASALPSAATIEITPEQVLMNEAKSIVEQGRERYRQMHDYSCVFTKRERMANGRLVGPHVMEMKVRSQPRSIYFRFAKPHKGRECIWVDGRYEGKMLVHDVGLGKLVAGTLQLETRSGMAMENNRHPITEAGVGFLLDELAMHWAEEMLPGKIEVSIAQNARVNDRACTMIESKHPVYSPEYLYHKVKVYFDQELLLPVRFEAYDWPRTKDGVAELVEEYNYLDLKIDQGLDDIDFDPANRAYSFGRF